MATHLFLVYHKNWITILALGYEISTFGHYPRFQDFIIKNNISCITKNKQKHFNVRLNG